MKGTLWAFLVYEKKVAIVKVKMKMKERGRSMAPTV